MDPFQQQVPSQQQYGQSPYFQQPQLAQVTSQQPQWQQVQPVQHAHTPQSYMQLPNEAVAQTHNTSTTTTTTTTQQYLANHQGINQNQNAVQQLTPQPQPAFNYMQLQQLPAPQPQPAPAIDYTQLQNAPISAQHAQHNQQVSTNTLTTATLGGRSINRSAGLTVVGGRARRAAYAKGEAELQRFDDIVQQKLMNESILHHPKAYRYYLGIEGYICGEGHHFVLHDEVDAMMIYGRKPRILDVNDEAFDYAGWNPFGVTIMFSTTPPPEGWHEPMHQLPILRRMGYRPPPSGQEHLGPSFAPGSWLANVYGPVPEHFKRTAASRISVFDL